MPYEITPLLLKCDATDFSVLISQIDSYVNLSSDSELKELLAAYQKNTSTGSKTALAKVMEREIRYIGSSDIAYAFRKIKGDDDPAGVSIHEVIEDVSKTLKARRMGRAKRNPSSRSAETRSRDRVELTGLRRSALPHHRTCGFPHPAVEPGGLSPRVPRG